MELTTTTTQQPTATLEVLTLEVKFYLNQTAQNIIEVGKRLAQAKELVPHGEWQNWLESNFRLSQNTAGRFMQVYKRFGNSATSQILNQSQMIAMLSLPAEETEQFIEAKAAEGKPVEDMTVKQLREEVQQWKSKAEVNEKALSETQIALDCARNANAQIDQDRAKIKADLARVQKELGETSHALYDAQKKLENQEPRIVVKAPADYESTKQALEHANIQNTRLRQQLADRPVEVQVPADYHDNKRELEAVNKRLVTTNKSLYAAYDEIHRMQDKIDNQVSAEDYANVAQKLDTIYALITDIGNSPNAGRVIADYERNNPERYARLCAKFSDFIRIMEME